MATDPQTLLAQAKCFQCYASSSQAAGLIELALLAQWAKPNVSLPLSFAPATAVIRWVDKNGIATGNLAAFTATADKATVSTITASALGLTSISGLGSLPALSDLEVDSNSLTSLDLTGCAALQVLLAGSNPLTTVTTSNPAMSDFEVPGCNLTVAAVNAILVSIAGFSVNGGFLDLSGQTPAAPPSGAGAAAKATLIAGPRLWTVLTD